MKRILLSALAIFALFNAKAQSPAYPKKYFRNPLNIPILLAGNFGECRPGHFHSGMDIKTGGHENEPVFAAADGYISRIRMESGGFGHGIYITHPNGYTTLYAHLNNFIPRIQAYVRQQQYAQQTWAVDLKFSPAQFPVKGGQQIAWSGNTGASTAPHLHFEIRNTKTEHPLNPQLFGFDMVDTKAPVVTKLAIYSQPLALYDLAPEQYKLSAQKGIYRPNTDTVYTTYGSAGIGITADDYMNGSDNTLAPLSIAWYADDKLQGSIRLDDIGYDETRYINAYADYSTRFKSGQWIQCLFRLPGNALGKIYNNLNKDAGIIKVQEGSPKRIRIELMDAAGNKSVIAFVLAQRGPEQLPPAKTIAAAAGKVFVYDTPQASFYLDDAQLYTAVTGSVKPVNNSGAGLRIFSPNIPVHHSFDLHLKAATVVPFSHRDNVAVMYSDGKDTSGKAASVAEKGFYKAAVSGFGTYWLQTDTSGPWIKPAGAVTGNLGTAKRISFKADDALTSIQTFRGELDGEWILFEQHGNNWFYEMDEHCAAGPHALVIKATDENGNTTTQRYAFTR